MARVTEERGLARPEDDGVLLVFCCLVGGGEEGCSGVGVDMVDWCGWWWWYVVCGILF